MNAPLHNINGLKNGSRMSFALPVGAMPKILKRVEHDGRNYGRDLERLAAERHGCVDVAAAHAINLAVRAEMVVGKVRYLLRHKMAEMTVADHLACGKAILDATQKRNKAVESLDLRTLPSNDASDLYDLPTPALLGLVPSEAPDTASDASCEESGSESGGDENASDGGVEGDVDESKAVGDEEVIRV